MGLMLNRKNALYFLLLPILGLTVGCTRDFSVRLVSVLPADELDLLKNTNTERLVIESIPEDSAVEMKTEEVSRGDTLHLKGITPGRWRFSVSGYNADGTEVVYGETGPVEVRERSEQEVPFFLGEHSGSIV